ncbi:hypothetical protein LA080_003751 [Diaporthe eres]|nr:hypothetical protein LA080_003751 [Diaporthe eres]
MLCSQSSRDPKCSVLDPQVLEFPPMVGDLFANKVPEKGTLLAHDNPDHDRLRKSIASFFVPRRLERFEPMLRAAAHDMIDKFVDDGSPGDKLFVAYNSGSRDGTKFSNPDVIDVGRRPKTQHLGFGRGVHACLGAPFARLLLKTELLVLKERLPNLRLDTTLQDGQDLGMIVSDAVEVASDVMQITLRSVDGFEVPLWTPGAHIDIKAGTFGFQQYSICSDPDDRHVLTIAVLVENNTGASHFVHATVRQESKMTIRGPRNNFAFVPGFRRTILIAGGIGITPIKPVAVVLGGLPEHRDAVLTPAERAEGGTVMTSVSRFRRAKLFDPRCTPTPAQVSSFTDLEADQATALLESLSTEVAIIDGRRGTGKSYLARRIIKTLVHNRENADIGPVICIFHDNSALDRMVDQLLNDGIDRIVRMGGRSDSERLQSLNLPTTNYAGMCSQDRQAEEHMSMFLDKLVGDIDYLILRLSNIDLPRQYDEYPIWEQSHQDYFIEDLRRSYEEYEEIRAELQRFHDDARRQVLQEAQVVTVTIMELARSPELLQTIHAKVLVCDNAGEFIESQIMAAILPSTEHIILIGDRNQLPPKAQIEQMQRTTLEAP